MALRNPRELVAPRDENTAVPAERGGDAVDGAVVIDAFSRLGDGVGRGDVTSACAAASRVSLLFVFQCQWTVYHCFSGRKAHLLNSDAAAHAKVCRMFFFFFFAAER